MTAKHTPTPWKLDKSCSGLYINSNGKQLVKILTSCKNLQEHDVTYPIAEANARHIVKCVNCFDELVEACKKALEIFHDYETGNHGGLTVSPNCLTLQQHQADYVYDIEQALAKAQEE